MFDNTPPRVASDLYEHRRRTYVWLRRWMVIVTSVFLITVATYPLRNVINNSKLFGEE